MINITSVVDRVFGTHSYILYKDDQAVLVDPSYSSSDIDDKLSKLGCELKAILVTHPHQDHVFSLKYFTDKYEVPAYMTKETNDGLGNPVANLSTFGENMGLGKTVINDTFNHVKDLDVIELLSQKVTVHHVPGHSRGCCLFEFDDLILTGDFIFKSSIGRYDFPESNLDTLRKSIALFKSRFSESDKLLYPGHNEFTTVQTELKFNKMLDI